MKIILYSQEHCGMCRAVHMQLDQLGVDYENVVITPENIEKCKEKGIMSTPTLIIDDENFSGSLVMQGMMKIREFVKGN